MSTLHSHHLLHLDLKPSNVLIAATGAPSSVRVCDFGITKEVTVASEEDAVGTPGYQSPEQLENEELSW